MIAKQPLHESAFHAQAMSPLTNPNLSAALRLEYDALLADVNRAHALCADFEQRLAGKSTEVDEFKELFAKTQADLFQLQDSIIELRDERHRLANEAMRAAALSRKLAEVTAERDRLRAEAEVLKNPPPPAPAVGIQYPRNSAVKETVFEIFRTLERLQDILDFEEIAKTERTEATQLASQSGIAGNSPS